MSTLIGRHPAPPQDRLERLLHARPSLLRDLVWRLGGPGRTFAVGRSDLRTGAAGLLVLVVLLALSVPHVGSPGHLWVLLPILLARLVARLWPVRLLFGRFAAELPLDTPLLCFWLLTEQRPAVLVAWLLATLAAELAHCHVVTLAGTNVAIAGLSATAASLVTGVAAGHFPLGVGGVVPCVLATCAYVVVDHALTLAGMRALGVRVGAGASLLPPTLWLAVGISSLLAAATWFAARLTPGRTATTVTLLGCALLVVVLVTLGTSLAEGRARLRHVVAYLHRLASFPDEQTALDELALTARRLVGTGEIVVRPWPASPVRRELGFLVVGGSDGAPGRPRSMEEVWLVARVRRLDIRFHPSEEVALETLATLAGEGIAVRRVAEDTAWLATHDALTRMPNRMHLLDRMHATERARDIAQGQACAVLLVDIDGFKGINDTVSHEAGDHVLAVLGPRIDAVVRSFDCPTGSATPPVAARLGGDEFTALLPVVDDPATVQALCEDIREAILQPILWEDRALVLDASIGYSIGPTALASSLLREADAAMYQVKHSGKGGIARYLPPSEQP